MAERPLLVITPDITKSFVKTNVFLKEFDCQPKLVNIYKNDLQRYIISYTKKTIQEHLIKPNISIRYQTSR